MDDDKKMAWKKLLSVFGVFFLIMAVWQIVVLELLKNGVIGTMVAMILICAATVIIFGLVFALIRTLLDVFRQLMGEGTRQEVPVVLQRRQINLRRKMVRSDSLCVHFRSRLLHFHRLYLALKRRRRSLVRFRRISNISLRV